jgi:hypothetical protein
MSVYQALLQVQSPSDLDCSVIEGVVVHCAWLRAVVPLALRKAGQVMASEHSDMEHASDGKILVVRLFLCMLDNMLGELHTSPRILAYFHEFGLLPAQFAANTHQAAFGFESREDPMFFGEDSHGSDESDNVDADSMELQLHVVASPAVDDDGEQDDEAIQEEDLHSDEVSTSEGEEAMTLSWGDNAESGEETESDCPTAEV